MSFKDTDLRNLSRRDLLKLGAFVAGGLALESCAPTVTKTPIPTPSRSNLVTPTAVAIAEFSKGTALEGKKMALQPTAVADLSKFRPYRELNTTTATATATPTLDLSKYYANTVTDMSVSADVNYFLNQGQEAPRTGEQMKNLIIGGKDFFGVVRAYYEAVRNPYGAAVTKLAVYDPIRYKEIPEFNNELFPEISTKTWADLFGSDIIQAYKDPRLNRIQPINARVRAGSTDEKNHIYSDMEPVFPSLLLFEDDTIMFNLMWRKCANQPIKPPVVKTPPVIVPPRKEATPTFTPVKRLFPMTATPAPAAPVPNQPAQPGPGNQPDNPTPTPERGVYTPPQNQPEATVPPTKQPDRPSPTVQPRPSEAPPKPPTERPAPTVQPRPSEAPPKPPTERAVPTVQNRPTEAPPKPPTERPAPTVQVRPPEAPPRPAPSVAAAPAEVAKPASAAPAKPAEAPAPAVSAKPENKPQAQPAPAASAAPAERPAPGVGIKP